MAVVTSASPIRLDCIPFNFFRRRTSSNASSSSVSTPTNVLPQKSIHWPAELCRQFSQDLERLATVADTQRSALAEDVNRRLRLAREVFEECAGDRKSDRCFSRAPASPSGANYVPAGSTIPETQLSPQEAAELLAQYLSADLPARLVVCLSLLGFEARKDVIAIFSSLLRIAAAAAVASEVATSGDACSIRALAYVRGHPQIFRLLIEGHENPEISMHCGLMLRTCARHKELVQGFVASGQLLSLVQLAGNPSFDISSDAFSSLREFVLGHKSVSAPYLEANFHEFFRLYNALLQSENYVTQRQSLKLLSEIMLDRSFMKVMLLYIEDDQFLQIHMNLLRDNSKAIQFEAFHVFKIFVANPQKPIRVQSILYKNKERLMTLLETYKVNRQDDEQYLEDHETVIAKLQGMEAPPKVRLSSQLQPQGQQILAQ